MESTVQRWNSTACDAGVACLKTLLQPLVFAMHFPSWLFLLTLLAMMLRPPDLAGFRLDRIAFFALVIIVLGRTVVRGQSLRAGPAMWGMLALSLLVARDLWLTPYNVQLWSVAAAKYFVPFAMFYLAGLVFEDDRSIRQLELFSVVALGYLAFTSVAYVAGLHALVFPRFIVDPSLGMHFERARGPFLQAQANGTAMNLLGLIVLDSYRRKQLPAWASGILLGLYPLAILATKTRAVWLTFAVTTALFAYWTGSRRVRRLCTALTLVAVVGLLLLVARSSVGEESAQARLTNGETVDFRFAAYRAGWTMFLERPMTGWGASPMETELADRIEGYHGEVFVVHNTYFEILLEYGLAGFLIYGGVVWSLARTARLHSDDGCTRIMPDGLRRSLHGPLWPALLAAYFISGCFVVMNYQFVNALIFSLAGILATDLRRTEGGAPA